MKILSMVLFLSVICYAELPILQTGQTKVYSSGDNGTHQRGAKRSYTKQGEVVIDNTTGLMWQNEPYTSQEKEAEKANTEHGKVLKWGNAVKYCEALELEGYSDWRLPSLKELKSLVDYSRTNPSIDDNVFKVMPNGYWSSTLYMNASDDDNAWVVYFNGGHDFYYRKDTSTYVRCVRGQ